MSDDVVCSIPVKHKPKQNAKRAEFFGGSSAVKDQQERTVSTETTPHVSRTIKTKEQVQPRTESSFLRLLRERKEGIAAEAPADVETAYRDDVPIAGFGRRSLQAQGLIPGQQIGSKD